MQVRYPCPGSPALAGRVQTLLGQQGIACGQDPKRGLDHGSFVPLNVLFPAADIPVLGLAVSMLTGQVVQLSLLSSLAADKHLALGAALAPLRAEGVLIIGSGFSFHNMGAFGRPEALQWSTAFNSYLVEACTAKTAAERNAALAAWTSAPHAR